MTAGGSIGQRAAQRLSTFLGLPTGHRTDPRSESTRRRIAKATAMSAAILASACSAAAPACTTSVSGGFKPPVFSPALGTKTDWSNLARVRGYLRSLPGGVTFYEVPWCEIEPQPGTFDWSKPDAVVKSAASLGFTTMIKIRVGQCWATGKSPRYVRGVKQKTESGMPQDLSAYARFVRSVVNRYSSLGVHEYAVENEVNSPSFWAGTPDEYRTLVRVAATAIHGADPKAVVLDSGISSTAAGYGLANWLLAKGEPVQAIAAYNTYFTNRFGTRGQEIAKANSETQLRGLLDSQQGRRNAAFIATTNRLVGNGVVDARQVHFYEQWSALPYLMQYLQATTPAKTPLEMWETGAFIGNSRLPAMQRSADLIKTVALALSEGASKVVWIPVDLDPSQPPSDSRLFGLLTVDDRERASSSAFRAMSAAAKGAQTVAVRSHGIVGVGFDKGSRSTVFIWAACAPTTLRLPQGSRVHGLTSAPASNGGRQILVSANPVQIELPTTVTKFLNGLA